MVFSIAVSTGGVLPWKKLGGQKVRVYGLTADATYAAGGYAVTAAGVGMSHIHHLFPFPSATAGASDSGWVPVWDTTNAKVKVYGAGTAGAALDEADTNEANLTGIVFQMLVIGY